MYLAWVDSDASSQSRTLSCVFYPQFAFVCVTLARDDSGWVKRGQTNYALRTHLNYKTCHILRLGTCMVYSSFISLSTFVVVHVNSLGWLVTTHQHPQLKPIH